MLPDRNRISPSRTKSGTVPSDAVVPVSNIEFTTMPNAASPKVSTTPEMMMIRKARKIGAPVRNSATRIAMPVERIAHHSMTRAQPSAGRGVIQVFGRTASVLNNPRKK